MLLMLVAVTALANAPETLWVDTDCGFFGDDGAALVLIARSPQPFRLAGVSTVSGNVWGRSAFAYTGEILRLLGRPQTPLFLGAERPLVHTAEMSKREGKLQFAGAFALPEPPRAAVSSRAVEAFIDAVERAPGQFTVLALGPLTNLALAFRLRPGLDARIRRLVVMGGNVRVPGNVTAAAEFNFWFDPEAAQAVLRSRIPEKVLVALDLSNQAVVRKSHFDEIVAMATPITARYREDAGHRWPGFLTDPAATGFLWDELAAAWLVDPSIVTAEETLYLDVVGEFGPRYGAVVPLDRAQDPRATPVRFLRTLDFPRLWKLYKSLMIAKP